jgi:hypothetical protein
MSALIERLMAQLPPEGEVWKRASDAAQGTWARQVEEYLRPKLIAAIAAPADMEDNAWKQLLDLNEVFYAARRMPDISGEFRIHAALAAFQRYSVLVGTPLETGRLEPRCAPSRGQLAPAVSLQERVIFGDRREIWAAIVAGARRRDSKLV